MLPKSEYLVKGLVWNCCVISFLLLAIQPESSIFAESKRMRNRISRIRNNGGMNEFSNFDGRTVQKGIVSQELIRSPTKHAKMPHGKRRKHFSSKSRKDVRIEKINHNVLNFPELSRLINPGNHKTGLHRFSLPASDKSYLRGHDRLRRLYCRGGIGYHLEILSNGKVVGRHRPTDNGKKIYIIARNLKFENTTMNANQPHISKVVHTRLRYLCTSLVPHRTNWCEPHLSSTGTIELQWDKFQPFSLSTVCVKSLLATYR